MIKKSYFFKLLYLHNCHEYNYTSTGMFSLNAITSCHCNCLCSYVFSLSLPLKLSFRCLFIVLAFVCNCLFIVFAEMGETGSGVFLECGLLGNYAEHWRTTEPLAGEQNINQTEQYNFWQYYYKNTIWYSTNNMQANFYKTGKPPSHSLESKIPN